jgi:hypothetical protein
MSRNEGVYGVILKSKLAEARNDYDLQMRLVGSRFSVSDVTNRVLIAQNDLIITMLEANNRILQDIREGRKYGEKS